MGPVEHRCRGPPDGGNLFYPAAIWDPPLADWPLSYRILTIPAGADVIPYQSRHGVIVHRRDVMHWLDGTLPNETLFEEPPRHRSEEHTSELQSLMRISYAVFCLKKKKQQKRQETHRFTPCVDTTKQNYFRPNT